MPSGNVGNSIGACWARLMGFPVREIARSANSNRVVPDRFDPGRWEPRTSPFVARALPVDEIVGPLIGATVELSPRLADLLARPSRVTEKGPGIQGFLFIPAGAFRGGI